MRGADEVASLGHLAQDLATRFARLRRIAVVRDGGLRMPKLNRGDVHDVAPHEQMRRAAFDEIGDLTGRMAGQRDGANARFDHARSIERLEAPVARYGSTTAAAASKNGARSGDAPGLLAGSSQ
jgi:hypothetical protein